MYLKSPLRRNSPPLSSTHLHNCSTSWVWFQTMSNQNCCSTKLTAFSLLLSVCSARSNSTPHISYMVEVLFWAGLCFPDPRIDIFLILSHYNLDIFSPFIFKRIRSKTLRLSTSNRMFSSPTLTFPVPGAPSPLYPFLHSESSMQNKKCKLVENQQL